jgi:hypothetical protein
MNSSILALDLVLTAILTYIQENRNEIDAMPQDEFVTLSDTLQAKRKAWMAKYK